MSYPAGDGPFPAVHVLFGTETGNSKQVAEDLTAAARARGVEVTLSELNDVPASTLTCGGCALVVISTNGDGEMPWSADRFWAALTTDSAPRLDGLSFAVLGLGDSGYFDFCQASIDLDARFEVLGARRLWPLRTCDADYEDDAAAWTAEILDVVTAVGGEVAGSEMAGDGDGEDAHTAARQPVPAVIARSRVLSGPGALKQVLHLELALGGHRLDYRPGDSLGVVPCNDPRLVDALLAELGADGDEQVDGRTLRAAFTGECEISRPSRDLVEALATRTRDADLAALLTGADRRALHEFLWARDVIDLLRLAVGPPLTATELLGLLRPLAHRSYSISSSPLTDPDRVDLTVAALRYRAAGRDRGGVCSTHLADRLTEGDPAPVLLEANDAFRMPADGDTPMVMIGPGTGVAPFRAFLHERRALGARGLNWLFFGNRHRRCDLLYGEELLAMADDGLLTRLDLAFSRDQADKVYVQTRMHEQGKRLYAWLAEGAHLYVCGDAVHMAEDVDRALHEIVAEHGGLKADGAAEFVANLRHERRYQRDVY